MTPKRWELSRDKYMSMDEVRRLRRSAEDRALADLAKGRTTAVRTWAVIDLALSTGLPGHFSIHACRHSYGTYLYQKTKDLRLVQDQLGHSSPIVTQVYSHITPEERVRSVNGLWSDKQE